MKIQERRVSALQYGDHQFLSIYVAQKPGDCRKAVDPSYTCLDNCEGNLMIARFVQGQPFSVKAIAPKELHVHPHHQGIRDISDLEECAKVSGYTLAKDDGKAVLYFEKSPIAVYTPCGFSMSPNLWSQDTNEIIDELTQKIDQVYAIAEKVPEEAVVNDNAVASQLNNPLFEVVLQLLGPNGAQLRSILEKGKQMWH